MCCKASALAIIVVMDFSWSAIVFRAALSASSSAGSTAAACAVEAMTTAAAASEMAVGADAARGSAALGGDVCDVCVCNALGAESARMGPTPADGDVTLLSLTAFNAEPAGMLVLASMECCALVL